MQVVFKSDRVGFLNGTVKALNDKKTRRLCQYKSIVRKDSILNITHSIDRNGKHVLKLKIENYLVTSNNNNYEVALIYGVDKLIRKFRKQKTLWEKKHNK